MDLTLSAAQERARADARAFASAVPPDARPERVVASAADAGLLWPDDLLAAVLVVDAVSWERPAHAVTLAVQMAVAHAVPGDDALRRGARLGAMALSSDGLPTVSDGRITGKASWAGPLGGREGLVLVGAHDGGHLSACAVALSAAGVHVEPLATAALAGFRCGHLHLDGAACTLLGSPTP